MKSMLPEAWIASNPGLRKLGFHEVRASGSLDFHEVQVPGGLDFHEQPRPGNLDVQEIQAPGSWMSMKSKPRGFGFVLKSIMHW